MFERISVVPRVVVALVSVLLVTSGTSAAPSLEEWPMPPTPTAPPPPPDSPTTGPATPLDPGTATKESDAVTAYAHEVAAGMTAAGPMVAGTFKEGEILEQLIQLMPGKCYTVVAVGTGITEVGLRLEATMPPMPPTVLAEDRETGPRAVIGPRGTCFKNPMPMAMNARFIIKAGRGGGVAAAQAYVK